MTKLSTRIQESLGNAFTAPARVYAFWILVLLVELLVLDTLVFA